ncbi:MAG: hypothetical protein JWQ81_6463 [Amycolatopsis sp.]|uniref:hypothetical protein n=1 Tax=Amycolatopsis sp. TaxID=37632 RepID=UPI0026323C51|nr:hypothetical protein [Amycolatopsis sp.]MCU1685724.1 hypothetical protein [Amycolatopsis sp.]
MTQASANERQGGDRESGRAGRWISRALLVLGGIAAGTVAAWAVSGASASADTLTTEAVTTTAATTTAATGTTVDATPVTDATVSGLNDVTHGVSGLAGDTAGTMTAALRDTACHQDATTWTAAGSAEQLHPLPAWCAQVDRDEVGGPLRTHGTHRSVSEALGRDVAGRVSDAVDNFTATAITHPVKTTLSAVERIVTKPQDAGKVLGETLTPSADDQGLGHQVWDFLNPVVSGSGLLPGSGSDKTGAPIQATAPADPSSIAQTVTKAASFAPGAGRSAADESSIPDGSTGGHHDFPTPFSPVQFPIAPLTTPTVPGGGNAPGGHFDGSTAGVPAWSSAAFDNAIADLVRVGVRYMPLTPGSQPGVTPD